MLDLGLEQHGEVLGYLIIRSLLYKLVQLGSDKTI